MMKKTKEKSQSEPNKEEKILHPVQFQVEETNALYLKEWRGEANVGDEKFEIDHILPTGLYIRSLKTNKSYVFSTSQFVEFIHKLENPQLYESASEAV